MHTSKHRVKGELVEIDRTFNQAQLDAGYDRLEFGEPATPKHKLLGTHDDGGIVVGYLAEDLPGGMGGPVFQLTFPSGASVTVLCADTVRAYLDLAKGE